METPENIQMNKAIITQDKANADLSQITVLLGFLQVLNQFVGLQWLEWNMFFNLVMILSICHMEQGCQDSRLKTLFLIIIPNDH
jgi:hypothetical protein